MDHDAPAAGKDGLDPELEALAKQLEGAQAAQAGTAQAGTAQAGKAADTVLGFTPGALFLGLVLSAVAIGYIRYAKVTSELSPFIVGVVLLAMTYLVQDAWILLGSAVGVIALSIVVKRYVRF